MPVRRIIPVAQRKNESTPTKEKCIDKVRINGYSQSNTPVQQS